MSILTIGWEELGDFYQIHDNAIISFIYLG